MTRTAATDRRVSSDPTTAASSSGARPAASATPATSSAPANIAATIRPRFASSTPSLCIGKPFMPPVVAHVLAARTLRPRPAVDPQHAAVTRATSAATVQKL